MKTSLKQLRIATRSSPLALWQAEDVSRRLKDIYPELDIQLVTMTTRGDKILDAPLAKVGGKGLFVKELETGMLDGIADIAVHSMKDVPVEFPEGLELALIMEREDPRDAFVSNNHENLSSLPDNSIVGTSSLRRQTQIKEKHPNLKIDWLRGNVNTRLKKLDDGQYDAIILAAAGLKRLEFNQRIRSYLEPEESLPAIGQGAIGIETRCNDEAVQQLIAPLAHTETTLRVQAERAMNETLNGGCQVPLAGYAVLEGDQLYIRGLVGEPDGSRVLRAEIRGPATEAHSLGVQLANNLLDQGAGEILSRLHD